MGFSELTSALLKEAGKEIGNIWSEAEASAGRIIQKTLTSIRQACEESERKIDVQIREQQEDIISGAERKAREARLFAEERISKRLYELSLVSLRSLRDEDYRKSFVDLVREIPEFEWEEIRVNPADRELARQSFEGARTIDDSSISGGMIVHRQRGRITIDNTFEKRLERAWPLILPALIRDIYRELGKIRD